MREFDSHLLKTARDRVEALEAHLVADVILYHGPIYPVVVRPFRDFLEDLKSKDPKRNHLAIVLNTLGGSAETVEKLVEMIRYHYKEVSFIIPDKAMSAGTIFALSGDTIYMDYTSSLGPIDPQVHNGEDWVPALGYLDQVEAMIKKSSEGRLTDVEILMLQNLDLAMLSRYEQAKNLTITLLKRWLVDYKFKDWNMHETSKNNRGNPVTEAEKEKRAEEIALLLSDNKIWHSHGREIGVKTVQEKLKLKIQDYSTNDETRSTICAYSEYLIDYIQRHDFKFYFHNRLS